MEAVASYIFSLVCGGILCAVVLAFGDRSMTRLLCGIFMLFLAITPLRELDLEEFTLELDSIRSEAEDVANAGKNQADEAMVNIITETCASYILTEADQLGAQVTVQVEVDPGTQLPTAVTITGTVTPYARQILSNYMTDTLGIPKEAQQWISA